MRKVAFLLCLVVVSAGAAYAGDCTATTYDQYIVNNFTCSIGDQTFSDFMYTGTAVPQSAAIPASSIAVTPITTTGNYGFQWSAPWFASTSSGVLSQDSLFQFNVNSSMNPITSLTLTIAGAGIQGTGAVVVDETACLGALLPTCTGGQFVTLQVFDNSSGQQLVDTVDFTGVNEVSVAKDVTIQAGTNGQAELSLVTDQFGEGTSTVPEPGTLSMLGAGALALAGFARRKIGL